MARRRRRLSDEGAAVLAMFVRDPERARFGRGILKDAELKSGSLYPILHRLEERGLLVSSWEPLEDAVQEGRRPRRLYRLNADQAAVAEDLLEEWRLAQPSERGRLAPKVALG